MLNSSARGVTVPVKPLSDFLPFLVGDVAPVRFLVQVDIESDITEIFL